MLLLAVFCLLIATAQGLNCSQLDVGTSIAPVQGKLCSIVDVFVTSK